MDSGKNTTMIKPSRNIKGGIVGLTNVGKTSVFNMLTNSSAPVDTSVFTTIGYIYLWFKITCVLTSSCVDPNYKSCVFPDDRLDVIAEAYRSSKRTFAYVSLLDTCGLVRDAHVVRNNPLVFTIRNI